MTDTNSNNAIKAPLTGEHCLTKLLGTKEYTQLPKCLLHAETFTNWKGETVTLKSSLKLQYSYMLSQFKGFQKAYRPYHEAQQTIADKLGFSLNTVKSNIVTLKEMGLLQVELVDFNKYETRVISIEWLQGTLHNKTITQKRDKKSFKYSFEESKIVKRNFEQFDKVKQDLTTEYIAIPKEEFLELIKRKQ